MKKLIIACLLFIPIYSFGQTENYFKSDSVNIQLSKLREKGVNHLKFKNIPIDGSISSFVKELEKQDYKALKVSKERALVSGKFTGEDVYILIQASSKSVYGVTVMFEEHETWKSIKSQYDGYKIQLTEKYGNPIEIQERFNSDLAERTGTELYALKDENYEYYSLFKVNNGDGAIKLSISPDAQLIINYVDTMNFLIANAESRNDL